MVAEALVEPPHVHRRYEPLKSRLWFRMVAAFALLSVVSVSVNAGLSLQTSMQEFRRNRLSTLREIAHRTAEEIHQRFEGRLNELRQLSLAVSMDDRWTTKKLLLNASASSPDFQYFTAFDDEGTPLASTRLDHPPIDPEILSNISMGRSHVSQAYFSKSYKPVVTITTPVRRHRLLVGALVTELSLQWLNPLLNNVAVGQTGSCWLMAQGGITVAGPDERTLRQGTSHLDSPIVQAVLNGREGTRIRKDDFGDPSQFGRETVTAFVPLRVLGWGLILKQDSAEVFSATTEMARRSALSALAMLALAVIIGTLVVRQILRPLETLESAVEKVANGDLGAKVPVRSEDEVGRIGEAFNAMTESLVATTVTLDFVERIQSSMVAALMVFDPDGTIRTVNAATCQLLDYESEALIGHPANRILGQTPAPPHQVPSSRESGKQAPETILETIIRMGSVREVSIDLQSRQGVTIPVFFSGSVVRLRSGELTALVAIAQDRRELLRLMEQEKALAAVEAREAEARNRSAELEETNRELKETHTQLVQAGKLAALGELGAGIAHELNQPLTGILGFAKMAIKDLDADNPLAKDMTVIQSQAERMSAIIKKILIFTRPEDPRPVRTRISDALNESLTLIRAQLVDHLIDVDVDIPDDLPDVLAVSSLLQQVFLNLLTNARDAIDEQKGQPGGLIKIIARPLTLDDEGELREDPLVEIRISDTGVDVPRELEDRLFDPFFSTKVTGKGTGLGLSLIHGIMRDLGGQILFKRDPAGHKGFVLALRQAEVSSVA